MGTLSSVMHHARFVVVLLAVAATPACKDARTTLTVEGSKPPDAAITNEMRSLFTILGLDATSKPKVDGNSWALEADRKLTAGERGNLDAVLDKIAHGKPRTEPLAIVMEAADASARYPVQLIPRDAKRELRSSGNIGRELTCSWDVPIDADLPAAWVGSGGLAFDPQFKITTDVAELEPSLSRVHVFVQNRLSFVFDTQADVRPAEFGDNASSEAFQSCAYQILDRADPFFTCNVVFPHLCAWMRSHQLRD